MSVALHVGNLVWEASADDLYHLFTIVYLNDLQLICVWVRLDRDDLSHYDFFKWGMFRRNRVDLQS